MCSDYRQQVVLLQEITTCCIAATHNVQVDIIYKHTMQAHQNTFLSLSLQQTARLHAQIQRASPKSVLRVQLGIVRFKAASLCASTIPDLEATKDMQSL